MYSGRFLHDLIDMFFRIRIIVAPSAATAAVLPTCKHEFRIPGRFVLTDKKSAEPLRIDRPQRRTHHKHDKYNGPISHEHTKYYRAMGQHIPLFVRVTTYLNQYGCWISDPPSPSSGTQ